MALHVLLQTISLVALVVMLVVTMQMDDLPSSTAFNLMVMAVLFVVLGYLLELLYAQPEALYISRGLQMLGVLFAYPLNLYSILLHFKSRLPSPVVILLLFVPIFSIIPLFLTPGGQLATPDMLLTHDLSARIATGSVGMSLLLYFGYPFLCLLASVFALVQSIIRHRTLDRRYAIVFLVTTLLPALFAALYYARLIGSVNPYSMMLAWCCVASGIVTLPHRVGTWASYARELALENSFEGYALLDAGNRYIESNSFVKKLYPVLQSIRGAVPISYLPELQELATVSAGLRPGQTLAFHVGDTLLRVSSIQVEYGGKYVGRCIQMHDETDLQRLKTDISKIETTDDLTGFLNERTFARMAERDYHIALRTGMPVCIVALAVDGLEDIQNQHGTACLNYTVQSVSVLLRARLRKTDLIGHADDGSFLVFLPASSLADSLLIAEGFCGAIAGGHFNFEGITLTPTASAGVALLDAERHLDAERIITEAKAAMYTAQSTGGGRICTGGPKL